MIILKPDHKIQKRFPKIDFQIMSSIFSTIFDTVYKSKKKRNHTINIKMAAGLNSYYKFQAGTNNKIHISDIIFREDIFVSTLLHEFRHFVQDKVFRIPLTKKNYDETTTKSYMNSPVEIDATTFEQTFLCRVLEMHNKQKKDKKFFMMNSDYKGT
jgi:hypothetical protein